MRQHYYFELRFYMVAVSVSNTGGSAKLSNTFTKQCIIWVRRILNLTLGLYTSNYDNPFVISDCLFIMINYGGFGRAVEFYNTGSGAGFPGGGLITNCTLFGRRRWDKPL